MASRRAPSTPPVRPAGRTQALQESDEMSGLAMIIRARSHTTSQRVCYRRQKQSVLRARGNER
jgi:hypothetical protein